ncbi:AI-2E family transporter [Candidatus Chloroploca asiatica]|uniref:AI-2E family transporter n=1 Tax=Candidatus Chloroploca asiatica TaxID=1506545 RepID=A0A2H3KTQ2_9CHLR|nr:AI-2E family transporter [Candidatus Chloroploca asiatica]PDV97242.1 hypothetical protein A9Q02_04875 [Candidatus Chloroploca asiatica]
MELPQPQATTILRPLLIIASLVLILGAMRVAAPLLNPLLLALVITLLCNPIYLWLQKRGIPSWFALLIMVLGMIAFAAMLTTALGISITRLTSQLGTYQRLLAQQEHVLREWLASYGFVANELQFFGLLNSVSLVGVLGSILAGIGNVLGNSLIVTVLVLFFLIEMPSLRKRLSSGLGEQSPLLHRLATFGGSVVRYFGVRTYINLTVAVGSTIGMVLLQVPFSLLWGVLIFVLGYIPYIGIPTAALPAFLLTLAEHGFVRALIVLLIITTINLTIENLIAPSLIGRELSLSPAVVFVAFFFWTWILGPPGTFLSMPITVLVVVLLDSYDETRWMARLMGLSLTDKLAEQVEEYATGAASTTASSPLSDHQS